MPAFLACKASVSLEERFIFCVYVCSNAANFPIYSTLGYLYFVPVCHTVGVLCGVRLHKASRTLISPSYFCTPFTLACEASVSVLFWSKGHAKNGASKPLSFFASRFISRAAKTENLVPRSFFAPKQHGNACFAG